MEITQILVLTFIFCLSGIGYSVLNVKFRNSEPWLRQNVIFLCLGIISAAIFAPFTYPFSFSKTLPVFTIIPFCAFNSFYGVNRFLKRLDTPVVLTICCEILSLVFGSILGMLAINRLRLGVFTGQDIISTSAIVFVISVVRLMVMYSQVEITNRRSKKALAESQKEEAGIRSQLQGIEAKINPHFLYNSLTSIASLALVDGKKTRDMTIALAKLLRYSLNYSESLTATIGEEINILEIYLEVEKVRFGENLDYKVNVSERGKKFLVPRFLLQPIVENCIKHAFADNASGNFISLTVVDAEHKIEIEISDNGKLFPEKLIPGFGFKSVTDKLQLLFPGKYDFEISNEPEKVVRIVIKELKVSND